jgi:oligosaccharide reducing-end xylanase
MNSVRISTRTVLIYLVLTWGDISKSQTIDPGYEVATWLGFRNAAITYTFDDGCPNQFTKAIPMLNEFGFGGTFFTVTSWSPNWSALQNAVLQGHEVGSHTVTHADLSTLDKNAQNAELENSANAIYSHIEGLHGLTLAYPYCRPSLDSLTRLYYFAARHCQGNIESSTPVDLMNISSLICGELGSVNSSVVFQQKADTASSSHGWCVYLIHGIDGDGGYSNLASATLRESLEYLDANPEKFWVGTFGNVVRYIQERNCLSVTELEELDDTIKIEVSDTLDNAIYNHPVTLRRPLPENWGYAAGLQAGLEIHTTVVEISSVKYIQFDAVPDSGEILIFKSDIP